MCPDLLFRVIWFPKSEEENSTFYAARIKEVLIYCRFHMTSFRKASLVDCKTSCKAFPNVLETVLATHEVSGNFEAEVNTFTNLITFWLAFDRRFFSTNEIPWLVISDKRAFETSRKDFHFLENQIVHFGTMVSSSDFVRQGAFSAQVKFFHDTRRLKIECTDSNRIKCLILNYLSIKHIVTNRADILIIFSDPPISRDEEETVRVDFIRIDVDVLGRSNGILLQSVPLSIKDELLARLHFRCFELPITYVNFTCLPTRLPPLLENKENMLDFSCRYLIEALFRRSFSLAFQGVFGFQRTAQTLYEENPRLLKRALSELVLISELCYPVDLKITLLIWFESLKRKATEEQLASFVPTHTTLVRSVVLTPTRTLLFPEELIIQNRFLRNFNPDFALKVCFRDDDFVKLNMKVPCEASIGEMTVSRPMLRGLQIAGRKYEFLGWSGSQIKNHSVWMYAHDDRGETAEKIRQQIGYFKEFTNVADFMARMGQCISETIAADIITINTENIGIEEDIERGLNCETGKCYSFSNGIGRISEKTVNMVCSSLKTVKKPSAFRIIYGGVEGTVVLDPSLKDKDIIFRRSMQKFVSNDCMMEILNYSAPEVVFLNRSMIQVLEERGVSTEAFLSLQKEAFMTLTEILLDSTKAAHYLQQEGNMMDMDWEEARKCGIDISSEPFFRAMLLVIHDHELNNIREEARLPIDPSEGRTMLGVIDETATLNYGQVFVQYTKDLLQVDNETSILTGRVLVVKNPCYVPGDVRIFQCVDVPGLHHIVDCVVFPQLGDRPHIYEMSGSDTYGTEYSVIWKEELFFNCNPEHRYFSLPPGTETQQPVTVEDMVCFLLYYITNDRFEYLAGSHLAISDEQGLHSPKSIEEAEYCYVAANFLKTGVFPNINFSEPKRYPDFMEKYDEETYKSKRALGKLFRISRDFLSPARVISDRYLQVKVDEDLVYPGWEEYRQQALSALATYSHRLQLLLGIYGLKQESQVMSGAFSVIRPHFKISKTRYDESDLVAICILALWKWSRDDFWTGLRRNDVYKKVSAYYVVTYGQSDPSVLSFPWVFHRYLSQLKQMRLGDRNQATFSASNLVLTQLNHEIEQSVFPALETFTLYDYKELNVCFKNMDKSLRIATLALLHWCKEACVIFRPNALKPKKGFMMENDVLRLIMNVIFTINPSNGAVPVIIKFLRYCISLRFLPTNKRNQILPFPLPQSVFISKQAMVAYRNLAVTGDLSALTCAGRTDAEVVEMEPNKIENQCAQSREALHQFLQMDSSVEVSVRPEGKNHYIINAAGHPSCVKELEALLRSGDQQFKTAMKLYSLRENVPSKSLLKSDRV